MGSSNLTLTAYSLCSQVMPITVASPNRDWMSVTDQRFANRCLPLLIANQSGWVIHNTVDFQAKWSGGDCKKSLVITHDRSGPAPLARSHFGHGIITWDIPYLFRTPPGYNLLVRGPANYPKDGVCALEGVVETDWTAATFTMNWKMTRPFTEVAFEEGETICMVVPQRRGELEAFQPEVRSLESHAEEKRRCKAFTASRQAFLERLPDLGPSEAKWQKNYFRGRDAEGNTPMPEHQTRLHLQPFGTPGSEGRECQPDCTSQATKAEAVPAGAGCSCG
ncbi:DUF6065 family protein [Streptomyces rhizosphaerihabitans]|uniref:DUF6065 family protein n=1 Tax=Streptomyces rhizosphaerihabitans TaxID=1266770 RepID=UPI0021C0BD82|nr:DUF6065 family protein [Streptomyces rhizosphaerihabitans]MCT9007122.1 DUF6065 family protein [Streptomyces rhizosphaerihabitans]